MSIIRLTSSPSYTLYQRLARAGLAGPPQPPPPLLFIPDFYVSPAGGTGSGSILDPWSLPYAVGQGVGSAQGDGKLTAGKTIAMRGGVYHVAGLVSYLTGTVSAPIILRQYSGERATIDGYMTLGGSYTWYWGFECLNSNIGSDNIFPGPTCLDVYSPGSKLINLIVHDASGNGIGTWEPAPDAEVYGCIVYNNGRIGASVGRHGHNIYFQNVTGAKRFVDNIVFNSYAYNFHGFSDAAHLNNIYQEGNISFNAAQYTTFGGAEYLVGGGNTPVNNLTFTGNYMYRSTGAVMQIGYDAGTNNPPGSTVTNNYLMGVWNYEEWQGLTVTGNTFVLKAVPLLWIPDSGSLVNFTWNNNTYKALFSTAFSLQIGGVRNAYDFAGWQAATGFDGSSTFQQANPTGQVIVVRPNQYEAKRANVVVYNWSGAASASVDLSTVLSVGDAYEIKEVQDYFGSAVASGIYDGNPVSVPMAAVTPVAPLGATNFPALSTGTEFHAFVVKLQGA